LKPPEENAVTSSPGFSPGRSNLPWAPSTLIESLIARPEAADRGHGAACEKGVAASISHGAGTSDTAKIRNADGRSAAGRRRGGRPNTANLTRLKPGTLKQSASAVSEPKLHPRSLNIQRLRRRVVTQQNLFFSSLMRSAGLL
jgi:hypothetical protein